MGKQLFDDDGRSPVIDSAALEYAKAERMGAVAGHQSCMPYRQDLSEWYRTYDFQKGESTTTRLIVLPPSENRSVLQGWAEAEGHAVLHPPDRERLLLDRQDPFPLEIEGEGLLVIPALEEWFLRHENGIDCLVRLLDRVEQVARPVLIGCNAWGWRFLCKAIRADSILRNPLALQAFAADRLLQWFLDLVNQNESSDDLFRSVQTGETLLSLEEQSGCGDYFRRLSASSLGIPWVAWSQWRRCLRRQKSTETDDGQEDRPELPEGSDRNALWVADPEEFALPGRYQRDAALILHALLIHGALGKETLRMVLPAGHEMEVLSVLDALGIVRRRNGYLCCSDAAYPTVRRILISRGFPKGDL